MRLAQITSIIEKITNDLTNFLDKLTVKMNCLLKQ